TWRDVVGVAGVSSRAEVGDRPERLEPKAGRTDTLCGSAAAMRESELGRVLRQASDQNGRRMGRGWEGMGGDGSVKLPLHGDGGDAGATWSGKTEGRRDAGAT